jgi:hypothetical protein
VLMALSQTQLRRPSLRVVSGPQKPATMLFHNHSHNTPHHNTQQNFFTTASQSSSCFSSSHTQRKPTAAALPTSSFFIGTTLKIGFDTNFLINLPVPINFSQVGPFATFPHDLANTSSNLHQSSFFYLHQRQYFVKRLSHHLISSKSTTCLHRF